MPTRSRLPLALKLGGGFGLAARADATAAIARDITADRKAVSAAFRA
jgi:hypothetical protein